LSSVLIQDPAPLGGGTFGHLVTIENDKNASVTLHDFKLLAAQENFANLSTDIPWSMIPPISLGLGTSTVIDANSSFTYNFITTGSFAGGHIYLNYQVDDPVVFFGDHPVPTPNYPSALLLGVGLAGLLACIKIRRSNTAQ
jgi:hypothetical protein